MLYGALEAGGTKMVCAVGTEDGKLSGREIIPTTLPEETIPRILDYFRGKEIAALGVASFGPIDPDPASPTYGRITSTPKPGWSDFDLLAPFRESLQVPIGFDTDVNASLLGEICFGDAKGLQDAVYITIGTGIGGGVMSGGKLLHGMLHPELGHMMIRPHPSDRYEGKCPYHHCCLEGMAAGPALGERCGIKGELIPADDPVWALEAYYIGQAIVNLILTLSPRRIILGGGVMHREGLFPMIRSEVRKQLNGYIRTPLLNDLEHYITPASLSDDQGILGCIRLAIKAKEEA
ncbi:MAG: ROK family protein [Lachnospiraceae bacterium]|nr:ROK family protein [Lachnospiraceae bacterium]